MFLVKAKIKFRNILMIPPDMILFNIPKSHVCPMEGLRRETERIRKEGIQTPLSVRRISNGRYELVSGECQLRAAKIVGLKEVPAIEVYTRIETEQKKLIAV